jgi:uncharacterized protein Yka (UPF0111/DUF47 family)
MTDTKDEEVPEYTVAPEGRYSPPERVIDFTTTIFAALTETITSLSEQLDGVTRAAAATEQGCAEMFKMVVAQRAKTAEVQKKIKKMEKQLDTLGK